MNLSGSGKSLVNKFKVNGEELLVYMTWIGDRAWWFTGG